MKIEGRVWFVERNGSLIDDVDTDQIYHNAHLHITDPEEMGKYAFGNLEGWEDFPSKAQPGDILVCGRNFGSGSSRQHAVECFKALGVSAVVALSFGAIYWRNAVNSGLWVFRFADDEIVKALKEGKVASGQKGVIDVERATFTVGNHVFKLKEVSEVQREIMKAGDLFAYGKEVLK